MSLDFLDRVLLETEAADRRDVGAIVPPDEVLLAQRDRLRSALAGLIRAYPRLRSEYATTEQQLAFRDALAAIEECGA